jgi:hypothetical protein
MYIANRFGAARAMGRAFRRGYIFANRGFLIWSQSFASGMRKSLCNNPNPVQSFNENLIQWIKRCFLCT